MKTLVISPHPDDEILGPGGTLLKRKAKKENKTYWLIFTNLDKKFSTKKRMNERNNEIKKISKIFKFSKVIMFNYPTANLDKIPRRELVEKLSKVLNTVRPDEMLVPHKSDVHSDHKIVSSIIDTCTKNFRSPFIKSVLAYETLSETNFNTSRKNAFFPNHYEDISKYLKLKINSLKIYKSEVKKFPFPRSLKTVKALATLRGSEIGTKAAESFEVLKQIK